MQRKDGYIIIPYHPEFTSASKLSEPTVRMAETIYKHHQKVYGESKSWHIEYSYDSVAACNQIKLVPNHKNIKNHNDSNDILSNQNEDHRYNYVITLENGKPMLRISDVKHFFLSNKAGESDSDGREIRPNNVIAAGSILFNEGQIAEYDDASGGYHLRKLNEEEAYEYRQSLVKAMAAVGLPVDKFKASPDSIVKELNTTQTNTMEAAVSDNLQAPLPRSKSVSQYNACRFFSIAMTMVVAAAAVTTHIYQKNDF